MTITYDPSDPEYLQEADVRDELTRAFGVCRDCRRCTSLCGAFPTLFEMIDRFDDRDPGRLTPAEQDRVIDACFQCKRCSLDCPYVPELHESRLDVPRLVLRADAMRYAAGQMPVRERIATLVTAPTGALGKLATRSGVAAGLARSPAGSVARRTVARTIGISAVRVLPPLAKQRFSTWMRRRTGSLGRRRRAAVTVFPTCLVEYHDIQVGKDLVRVYERNGVECSTSAAGCCGAPWLHAGDVRRFARVANRNVARLAAEVRSGTEIVVLEPTCSYVLRHDYVDHVDPGRRADADLVAAHTSDAAAYLVGLHRDTGLDTRFTADAPDTIAYHAPCHLRAQRIGTPGRDLMELTGATVTVVEQCSGGGGAWGWRAGNEGTSIPMAEQLAAQLQLVGGDVVAGDCSLANTAITEQTGTTPTHPVSVLARAYGIPVDD